MKTRMGIFPMLACFSTYSKRQRLPQTIMAVANISSARHNHYPVIRTDESYLNCLVLIYAAQLTFLQRLSFRLDFR